MNVINPGQTRRIIRQHLQTELLLGLRHVPLILPRQPAIAAQNSTKQGPPAQAQLQVGTTGGARSENAGRLRVLDEEEVRGCVKCMLSQSRSNTVFGQGSADARLVFVGEAPGFHEDQKGLAFVGKAGELLTKMIVAMGLSREEVFICNVLKCRPPSNRDPAPDEIAACSPYLLRQLAIIEPEVIVTLGAPASRTLLATHDSIGRLRGRFHDFHIEGPLSGEPIPLMPTYHPAYLLRSPHEKGKAWSDLQQVMVKLGLKD